ncbi:MAG TPA: hypothetical protein VF174_08895 [Micromonosporaceae bacterium]
MSPGLSRQLGLVLGRHYVRPDEREAVIGAALGAETWDDLPPEIRSLLGEIEQRGAGP